MWWFVWNDGLSEVMVCDDLSEVFEECSVENVCACATVQAYIHTNGFTKLHQRNGHIPHENLRKIN